jgi:hypothetical protein
MMRFVAAVSAAFFFAPFLGVDARADGSPLEIDFTDYRSGPIEAWLQSKGFRLESDAKSRQKIRLVADGRGLLLEALTPARGFLISEAANAKPFSSVEIEWGVTQYPQGASYERHINNEAIMVYFFFGSQKRPSGSMFVPDLPYFIGLFLCNGDRVGFPYAGRHHTESGRFVCLDGSAKRDPLVSRFDLKQGFRAMFGGDIATGVSGYSVGVDTTSSGGQGRSSALIKRIRFLD